MELDNAEDPATIDDPCTDVTQSADDVPVPNGLRTVVDSVETKRVITRGAAGNAVEGSNEVVGSQAKAPPISLSPGGDEGTHHASRHPPPSGGSASTGRR